MSEVVAYRYALDPTPEQVRQFMSHAGAARVCYNRVLAHNRAAYFGGQKYYPSHQNLRRAWYDNRDIWARNPVTGEIWWSENSKQVYDMACRNLAAAYKRFFEGLADRPTRKRANRTPPSFQFTGAKLVGHHHVQLPRIGRVKTHESLRKLIAAGPERIGLTTVSRDASGRWFVSLTVQVPDTRVSAPSDTPVGIDLGLKTLAVVMDEHGTLLHTEPNNRPLRQALVKLRRANKALARSQRNSNRRKRTKQKVGRLHVRVADVRQDQINKFTSKIAAEHRVVVVEDLHVKGMVRNRSLARAISDAGWGEIRRQLEYKVDTLVVADRFFASSKTCSGCGAVKATLLLSEREYVCSQCGLVTDRDENAAVNLARVPRQNAVGYTVRGRGHPVGPSERVARMGEASRPRQRSTRGTVTPPVHVLSSNAQVS